MKFRCHAVDERGRVVTEVLRAASEQEAREQLLEENLFPKRLVQVDEEEKVTWISSKRVRQAHEQHRRQGSAGERPALVQSVETRMHRGGTAQSGVLGMTKDEEVWFVPAQGEAIVLRADTIETARLKGMPLRMLEVFLLDGEALAFEAGFLRANSVAKRARKMLSRP